MTVTRTPSSPGVHLLLDVPLPIPPPPWSTFPSPTEYVLMDILKSNITANTQIINRFTLKTPFSDYFQAQKKKAINLCDKSTRSDRLKLSFYYFHILTTRFHFTSSYIFLLQARLLTEFPLLPYSTADNFLYNTLQLAFQGILILLLCLYL